VQAVLAAVEVKPGAQSSQGDVKSQSWSNLPEAQPTQLSSSRKCPAVQLVESSATSHDIPDGTSSAVFATNVCAFVRISIVCSLAASSASIVDATTVLSSGALR
jgi:hypothetical protein